MQDLIGACRALGEPTRLRAMRIILEARVGLTASELVRILGKPQYTLSKALGILVDAGLVDGTREGRTVVYHARRAPMNDLLFQAVKAASSPKESREDRKRMMTCLLAREDGIDGPGPRPQGARSASGRGRAHS